MRKIFTTSLLLLAAFFSFSQAPEIEWEKTIGGVSNEYLQCVQQTSDGGYILGGYSDSGMFGDKAGNAFGHNSFWVVKLDAAGNIQWEKTFGGLANDYLMFLEQTSDGGYILGGYSDSYISSQNKAENTQRLPSYLVVKLDAAGNIEWQKAIGGTRADLLYCVRQTSDGGYILGGYSDSDISRDKTENRNGNGDFWVVKLDTAGNIEWQRTIGGENFDYLRYIQQTSDGGYILGGYTNSAIYNEVTKNIREFNDYLVVKLDSAGNIEWQNAFGGSGSDLLMAIQQTSDGGYILGGYSNSGISGNRTEKSNGFYDYWVVKINTVGNIQWQKAIGGRNNDFLRSIQQTSDGGYILGGYSESIISGNKTDKLRGLYDYWVVKLDAVGNIQWQKTLGGRGNDHLMFIRQTSDGGYILGGHSDSSTSKHKSQTGELFDYWVVKLRPGL